MVQPIRSLGDTRIRILLHYDIPNDEFGFRKQFQEFITNEVAPTFTEVTESVYEAHFNDKGTEWEHLLEQLENACVSAPFQTKIIVERSYEHPTIVSTVIVNKESP